MDQRSKNNLPDLPPSNSKFWEGAEKHQIQLMKKEHKHFFKLIEREIICECGAGYPFTGRELVRDGNIIVT